MPSLLFGNFGKFEFSNRSLSLLNARIEFMNAISRCAPEVYETLHDEPLAKYKASGLLSINALMRREFWQNYIGINDEDFYFNSVAPQRERFPSPLISSGGKANLKCDDALPFYFGLDGYDPQTLENFCKDEFPKLQIWVDSLYTWASLYFLTRGWILHWAFLKLDSYADRVDRPGYCPTYHVAGLSNIFGSEIQPRLVEPGGLYDGRVNMEFEPLTFIYRGWRPTLSTEKQYADSARWWFEKELKDYFERSKSRLDSSPNVTGVWLKRQRAHFDWLVCRQVYGMTAEEILDRWWKESGDEEEQSRRLQKSPQAVNKAIKETARLIGITARRVGRGPKK